MAKRFSKKVQKQGLSFQLLAIRIKVMTRCLSVPDATSLHHCLQNNLQYFTILEACSQPYGVFEFHGGMVNHMQVLATPSSTVHN